MKIHWLKLVASILICQGAGIIGSFFTAPTVQSDWYLQLKKPGFQPPGWLFGPVWITLFLLMGIALYLVWNSSAPVEKIKIPLLMFAVNLALNIGWSFCFFYLKNPGLAFFEIVVLWATILLTLILFYQVNKVGTWLLVPYLAWVSFASILNLSIWNLNK